MRSFHLILSSGLLTGMTAYAQAATPNWSAFIGTGQAACLESDSCSLANSYRGPEGPDASSAPAPQTTFNWSAFIGTGQAACLESGSCSLVNSYRGPEGPDASSAPARAAPFGPAFTR
jgi:hypothetical protein